MLFVLALPCWVRDIYPLPLPPFLSSSSLSPSHTPLLALPPFPFPFPLPRSFFRPFLLALLSFRFPFPLTQFLLSISFPRYLFSLSLITFLSLFCSCFSLLCPFPPPSPFPRRSLLPPLPPPPSYLRAPIPCTRVVLGRLSLGSHIARSPTLQIAEGLRLTRGNCRLRGDPMLRARTVIVPR